MNRTARPPLDKRIKLGFILEPTGLCLVVRFMEDSLLLALAGAALMIWGGTLLIKHGRSDRRVTFIFPLLVIGWGLAGFWSFADTTESLRKHRVPTQAVVIDAGTANEGRDTEYRWIAYRYTAGGKEFVSRNTSNIWSVHDTIWVYYDSTRPQISEPVPVEELAEFEGE